MLHESFIWFGVFLTVDAIRNAFANPTDEDKGWFARPTEPFAFPAEPSSANYMTLL